MGAEVEGAGHTVRYRCLVFLNLFDNEYLCVVFVQLHYPSNRLLIQFFRVSEYLKLSSSSSKTELPNEYYIAYLCVYVYMYLGRDVS